MPIKKHRTPMPKWLAEKNIEFEKPKKIRSAKKSKSQKSQVTRKSRSSAKIKTVSIEAKCSCEGENENCFRCNGTGFYMSQIVTNIEACQDKIQKNRTHQKNPTPKNQFSNDSRGGIYGIREQGRYLSNPLHEDDI